MTRPTVNSRSKVINLLSSISGGGQEGPDICHLQLQDPYRRTDGGEVEEDRGAQPGQLLALPEMLQHDCP